MEQEESCISSQAVGTAMAGVRILCIYLDMSKCLHGAFDNPEHRIPIESSVAKNWFSLLLYTRMRDEWLEVRVSRPCHLCVLDKCLFCDATSVEASK